MTPSTLHRLSVFLGFGLLVQFSHAYIYQFEFDIIDQETEQDSLQAIIALTEVCTKHKNLGSFFKFSVIFFYHYHLDIPFDHFLSVVIKKRTSYCTFISLVIVTQYYSFGCNVPL